jgi:serine/threonine-protein kinase
MHELKKCNTCGNTFPVSLSFCLNDGSPLVKIDSMIGNVLDGRYRLDTLIGEGGMGDVYRATHVHLDTEFAVKLLKPEFVANETAIKRFRLEAKAAGRIHHPNAVRVTDFGVTPERVVFLVMELVMGQSLRLMIRNEGTLEAVRSVNIVRQVCGAVDAAHRGGVIHRDLKPDNILIEALTNAERVKVLDFGIAKLREAKTDTFLTQAGTIIGTPQYMSPEQCMGNPLDPRSDIYSIGVLIYEMLTGEVPFDGESTIQVVYNQLHMLPRPLREHVPNIPEPLAQVIMRALEKEPDKRQASAAQLSDELKRALSGSPVEEIVVPPDPLGTRPLQTVESKPEISVPTAGDERPSRSTTFLPRTDPEGERPTRPDDDLTVVRKTPPFSVEIAPPPAATPSRMKYIIPAAIAALVLIGAIALLLRPDTTPTTPPNNTPQPPEGMAYIPEGKFIMGRNDGSPDEGPAHEESIKPFFLDLHEVTNQEYKKFVDATGRALPFHWRASGTFPAGEGEMPVRYVDWDDANAYAAWAKKRLPSEAEWEYAARGGSKGFLYAWGNQWQPGYANVDRNPGERKPARVGGFTTDVSPFGIADMTGNVSEWVQDYYSERYGATQDQRLRVYRGGNFVDAPEKSTNTYRWADFPREIPTEQLLRIGFRCARDL